MPALYPAATFWTSRHASSPRSRPPNPSRRSEATSCLSWLPATLLECLVRVTPGFRFVLPELEELTVLPAPPGFRRPLAHHVFVLARFDHFTGNGRTEDHLAT